MIDSAVTRATHTSVGAPEGPRRDRRAPPYIHPNARSWQALICYAAEVFWGSEPILGTSGRHRVPFGEEAGSAPGRPLIMLASPLFTTPLPGRPHRSPVLSPRPRPCEGRRGCKRTSLPQPCRPSCKLIPLQRYCSQTPSPHRFTSLILRNIKISSCSCPNFRFRFPAATSTENTARMP